jgi:non-ribosomal peptide synthetase component F
MLGMVINTVPVLARLDGPLSFREHLKEVSRTLLEAADHESAPFEAVVRALNPDRSSGQVLFNTFVDSYDRPPNCGLRVSSSRARTAFRTAP